MDRLFLERRHTKRENLQTLGRSARLGGPGQAAADDVIQPVDLVSEGMAVGAQQVAVIESGVGKGPVLGPVYREAADSAGRAPSPSCVEAAGRIETEGLGPRPPDLRCLPGARGARGIRGLEHRILGARPVLVADLPLAAVLEAGLPHNSC